MYLDWEKTPTYTIDIETDSLKPTLIHVMCWEHIQTKEKGECIGHDEIREFFRRTSGSVFVGHNILCFDGPVVGNFIGVLLDPKNCIDTLVLSQLYSPSLSGGHSLRRWGEAFGEEKGDFTDFENFSREMVEYCHKDVAITSELFRRLMRTLTRLGFTEQSLWLQHNLMYNAERQKNTGFYFDGKRAILLYQEIRQKEKELQDEIRKAFASSRRLVRTGRVYRKDGERTAIYEKDCRKYEIEKIEGGREYRAFDEVYFNIGSPAQRTERLLHLGWVPKEFTPKTDKGGGGNPKPFDKGEMSPSLARFLEKNPNPQVEMIATWMALNGRANMINTWLENWNEETNCIHGKLYVANTLRFRHQSPNTANIPAVRQDKSGKVLMSNEGLFTYESRDLWVARPGRVLVGTDASGLELRMLAHYLDRPDFTDQVVKGDPHQYNADQVGITRPEAKTLIYAIMYGAGDAKIANTLGVPFKEGAAIKKMFLERLGIKGLMDSCKAEQAKGRIRLIDGSLVICNSPHASLNFKLQGGGARVMGLASVLLEREILRRGLDSLKVGDIHDEWQYDVSEEDADEHTSLSIECIVRSGVLLKMNVPLDADAKKGRTWAETH